MRDKVNQRGENNVTASNLCHVLWIFMVAKWRRISWEIGIFESTRGYQGVGVIVVISEYTSMIEIACLYFGILTAKMNREMSNLVVYLPGTHLLRFSPSVCPFILE